MLLTVAHYYVRQLTLFLASVNKTLNKFQEIKVDAFTHDYNKSIGRQEFYSQTLHSKQWCNVYKSHLLSFIMWFKLRYSFNLPCEEGKQKIDFQLQKIIVILQSTYKQN